MTAIAVDTSAAVPYLVAAHPSHRVVRSFLGDRQPVLTGHSLVETFSVLTRLPGDARLAPADADALIAGNFGPTVFLRRATRSTLLRIFADLGIAGAAVYDALVALPARDSDLELASRDARAFGTYAALAVRVVTVPS